MLNINEFKKHLHHIHNTVDDPSMNNQMRDRLSEQGPVCNMKEYKPDQKVDKSTDKPTTGAMDTLRPNSKNAEKGGTVKEGAADASAAGGKKPKKGKPIVVEDEVEENLSLAPKGKGSKAAKALYQDTTTEEEYEIHPSVLEYFENYFGDTLNEDTSDEDIVDAVEALVELRDAVCEAVGLKKNLTVDEAFPREVSTPLGDLTAEPTNLANKQGVTIKPSPEQLRTAIAKAKDDSPLLKTGQGTNTKTVRPSEIRAKKRAKRIKRMAKFGK